MPRKTSARATDTAPSSAALEIATRLVESADGYEASVLREEFGREYHAALTELGPKVRFFGSRIFWNGARG